MLAGRRFLIGLLTAATLLGPAAARAAVGPGAVLNTSIGQCTLNFLFDGSDGARYIASAGHCVLDTGAGPVDVGNASVGEKTWAPGTGPAALDANHQRIGEFVYAVLQDPKDFSLIRLDPAVPATPQMPTFGGPVGMFNDTSSATRTLVYYGHGIVAGTAVPARQAIAFGTPDPDHIFAWGLVTPGDSGGAIETSDGLATGVVVTIGANIGTIGGGGLDAGPIGITRLPPQLARAEQALGIRLALRTAPLLSGGAGTIVAPTTGLGSTTPVSSSASGSSQSAPASVKAVPKPAKAKKSKKTKKAKKPKKAKKAKTKVKHSAKHKASPKSPKH